MTLRLSLRAALPAVLLWGTGCRTFAAPGDTLLTSQPQWEWQSACCGVAGNQLTPATEGFSYVLQFEPDGTVRAIRNDTILVETRYRFETSGGGPTTDPATTLEYDEPLPLGPGIEPASAHLVVVQENGELLLRNLAPCADCFGDWRFLPSLAQ